MNFKNSPNPIFQEETTSRKLPMDILVRMPNWLGDAVMATSALANLRKHHPQRTLYPSRFGCRGPVVRRRSRLAQCGSRRLQTASLAIMGDSSAGAKIGKIRSCNHLSQQLILCLIPEIDRIGSPIWSGSTAASHIVDRFHCRRSHPSPGGNLQPDRKRLYPAKRFGWTNFAVRCRSSLAICVQR